MVVFMNHGQSMLFGSRSLRSDLTEEPVISSPRGFNKDYHTHPQSPNNTHYRTTIPYCTIHHSIICSDNDVSSHVSDRRRRPLIMQHLHCLHITYSAYREVLNIFVAIGSDIIETIVDDAAASHQRIARCTQNDRGGRRSAMGNVHPPSRLGWRMVGNLVHV